MAITDNSDGEVEKTTYWEVWDNAASIGIWAIGGVVVPGTIKRENE